MKSIQNRHICPVSASAFFPLMLLLFSFSMAETRLNYTIDMSMRHRNVFRVTLDVSGLTGQNHTFSVAAIDSQVFERAGELVRDLRATDPAGAALEVRRIGSNRWHIGEPERVARIEYLVHDTWHLDPGRLHIPEMLGSAIGGEFALVNAVWVLGYVGGLEYQPITLNIRAPAGWQIGTVLGENGPRRYVARDFTELTQSPILAGPLSFLETRVDGMDCRLYVFSREQALDAERLLPLFSEVVAASGGFMGSLPVDAYTGLFVLSDRNAGGVQYPGCGVFVQRPSPSEEFTIAMRDLLAHEFFHLYLPYRIHSDALNFSDFFRRQAPRHRWFYEGVTEWASHIMQVRAGLKSIEWFFLRDFRRMLFHNEQLEEDASLYQMSISMGGRDPFGLDYLSVYSRGALVATLLDIHIIHESFGAHGLQQVLRNLMKDYDEEHPLPQARFFSVLKSYCGADFNGFIERYVMGSEPLPLESVLQHLGLRYREAVPDEGVRGWSGFAIAPTAEGPRILWRSEALESFGIERSDILLQINGQAVGSHNHLLALNTLMDNSNIGDRYSATLRRGDERFTIDLPILPPVRRHMLEMARMLDPAQSRTFKAWLAEDARAGSR